MEIVIIFLTVIIIFSMLAMKNEIGNKSKNSTVISNQSSSIERKYELLKKEVDRKREENENWQKLRQPIITTNYQGEQFEKLKNYEMAMSMYEESTEYIKKNISNLDHIPVYGFERLMILYRKHNPELEIPFIKDCIKTLKGKVHKDSIAEWKIRLNKLENKNKKVKTINYKKEDLIILKPSDPTLGSQMLSFQLQLPEFEFYEQYNGNEQAFLSNNFNRILKESDNKILKKYHEIRFKLKDIIKLGEKAESKQNYLEAIKYYELAVSEQTTHTKPYERLMILYRKLKWKDKEIDLIKRAILFFTKLRESQKNYMYEIARTSYRKAKTDEYINNYKKIFYYGGAFELYNPYPIIEKWEKRLKQLLKKC